MLGNVFCNRWSRADLPLKKIVIITNEVTILISRSSAGTPDYWTLPLSRRYGHLHGRVSPIGRASKAVVVPARTIAWVFAATILHGKMVITPNERFIYE